MSLFSSLFGGGSGIFDAILGGISGASRGRSDREMARIQGDYALRNTREQGRESRRNTEFETLLGKWLRDKEKEDRRSGLSNFARFSSEDYGTPSYVPPAVGNMPTSAEFDRQFDGQASPPTKPPPAPKMFSKMGRGLK
jgi:hypothetical protein